MSQSIVKFRIRSFYARITTLLVVTDRICSGRFDILEFVTSTSNRRVILKVLSSFPIRGQAEVSNTSNCLVFFLRLITHFNLLYSINLPYKVPHEQNLLSTNHTWSEIYL